MTAQTDRELLELAAKAAGVAGDYFAGSEKYSQGIWCDGENEDRICWNPLTNDGDALRLAVKLHMKVRIDATGARVWDSGGGPNVHKWRVHATDDPFADARRAIVLAAAERGTHKEGA